MVDGDGCVSINKSQHHHCLQLIGRYRLMSQFADFVHNHSASLCTVRPKRTIFQVQLCGGSTGGPALTIGKLLYNCNGPSLDRKKKIVDLWPMQWASTEPRHLALTEAH